METKKRVSEEEHVNVEGGKEREDSARSSRSEGRGICLRKTLETDIG